MSDLIKQIFASGQKIAIAITGGGSPGIAELMQNGGASSTILEVVVPYSQAALVEYLHGNAPAKFCSEEAAFQMAKAAYRRAAAIVNPATWVHKVDHIAGIGLTCSLMKEGERAGRVHRAFGAVCVAGREEYIATEFTVQADPEFAHDRKTEEIMAGCLLVYLVARAASLHPEWQSIPNCLGFNLALPRLTEAIHDRSFV